MKKLLVNMLNQGLFQLISTLKKKIETLKENTLLTHSWKKKNHRKSLRNLLRK